VGGGVPGTGAGRGRSRDQLFPAAEVRPDGEDGEHQIADGVSEGGGAAVFRRGVVPAVPGVGREEKGSAGARGSGSGGRGAAVRGSAARDSAESERVGGRTGAGAE